jgi:hypothetical protein
MSHNSLSVDEKDSPDKKKGDGKKFQTIYNYCRGSKFYLDPQLLSKRKIGINTSTSKQMYRFGKERRFYSFKKPYDAFFYNLPSVQDRFTTTFGYGKKFDFTKNVMKDKTHSYYDIPREFEIKRRNTPQYSFGKGRDICKKPELKIETITPGVGSYNLRKELGSDALKFSIFGREWDHRRISPSHSLITPGPGHYEETLKMNGPGKYSSSLYTNTTTIKFIGPEKLKSIDNKVPAPWTYNLGTMFNTTGLQFTSKFDSTIAKTISNRPKDFYLPYKKSSFPGPGSYDSFSDFNGYTEIHKKCKCGRFLGHPPIYDDSKCGRNYSKSFEEVNNNESKEKKKKNLKIDTNNDNKNDTNKGSNINIATTTAN